MSISIESSVKVKNISINLETCLLTLYNQSFPSKPVSAIADLFPVTIILTF